MDYDALAKASPIADAEAVAYSLSGGGEEWTPDEVRAMRPAGIVEKIAVEVYRLSHVDPDVESRLGGMTAQAVQFLDDTRGASDSGDAVDGDEAGGESR